jgi:hypothetical protein
MHTTCWMQRSHRAIGLTGSTSYTFGQTLAGPLTVSLWCLWNRVWKTRHRLPADKRCQIEPSLAQLCEMPVRRQTNPLFRIPLHAIGPLVTPLTPFRHKDKAWNEHMVRSGFYCLQDFLTPALTWPTADQFDDIAVPAIQLLEYDGPVPCSLAPIYRRLTTIALRVFEYAGHNLNHPVHPVPWRLSFNASYKETSIEIREWPQNKYDGRA